VLGIRARPHNGSVTRGTQIACGVESHCSPEKAKAVKRACADLVLLACARCGERKTNVTCAPGLCRTYKRA
jgi:hypothetical protein